MASSSSAAGGRVDETVSYAADRGVTLAPSSVGGLFKRRGCEGARAYIDKLGEVMDAASVLGIECRQSLAARRLSDAKDDVRCAIATFSAERRRRTDRRAVKCRVFAPPRALAARANAFAGCGCPRCVDRLTTHMERYIGKLIAQPLFRDLDRDDARAEAHLELVRSVETWPGGNFTGWFAASLTNRIRTIYRSRSAEERNMLSLDADDVLSDDNGGRTVALGERVPDRSVDILTIVLRREYFAERELRLRQGCIDRCDEFAEVALS